MKAIYKLNFSILILVGLSNILFSQDVPKYVPKSGLIGWYPLDGNANDLSGNNLNGRISGATACENRYNQKNKAFAFMGQEYVEVANIPKYSAYTYSAWVKSNDINTESGIIVQKGPATNGSFGLSSFKGSYNCRHRNKEKKLLAISQVDPILTTDWHHLVNCWDGEKLYFYIDGKLQNTIDANSMHDFSPYLYFGALNVGDKLGYFFKGLIDDVGVWNRALSQNEVYRLFDGSVTVDDIKTNSISSSNNTETKKTTTKEEKIKEDKMQEVKPKVEKPLPIPVVKVKDRNPQSQLPQTILIFDKNNTLEIGNSIQLTRNETIAVPGERKPQVIPTVLGIGRVIEKSDKIITVRLDHLTAKKMVDYKDGDENFFCVSTETKSVIIAKPRIMVIPRTIEADLFVAGEYKLSDTQRKIISSLKNKLEDNDYSTIGFESILKKIYEDKLINEGTKTDIKSMILESSGADFYVEFDVFDSKECVQTLEFKIRNYATGEDVASDIKNLNTCGTPEDYKKFAGDLLNAGSLEKIDKEFNSLQNEGRKISLNFVISSNSNIDFTSITNGIRLEEHIENCIQILSFNGNYKSSGSVSNRISFPEVSISPINEITGQNYTANAFAIDILKYLKEQANVECEKTVIGSNINITIK